MTPEEIRDLAQLLDKLPALKGIDTKDVKRLAELLRDTPEIGSIELKGLFGTSVVITRTGVGAAAVPVAAAPLAVPMPAPVAAAPPPVPAAAPTAAAPVAALKEIRSPMVGTFYKCPEPGAEPYVQVGSRVASGQTVCIIEAMKIMNEIEAELTGVVREVCVDDAQPVEYGQVLFRIDPNG